MSSNDQKQLIKKVAHRYLNASVQKVAAWSMDMLARLSILEGAAGVAPGTWLRQKERGFGHALDFFGPKLPASWTSTRDQGVYDKALAAAAKILRNSSMVDPMDLIQDMIIGSTTTSGPARSRVFYSVGNALRKYENDLAAGQMTPNDGKVKGTIDRWVSRAAQDVLKLNRERKRQWERPEQVAPQYSAPQLDDTKRDTLILLALQSPGGPGRKLRHLIDQEISRSFPTKQREIVRAFLEKISHPKYRSPAEMKKLVSRFNPAKWFTQAYNLVRKEIMQEQGVSAQQLTNALGGNASKVFRFMREKIGRNPQVKKMIEELADQIELLEPGAARVAKKKERDASIPSGSALAQKEGELNDFFEMNEHQDWRDQTGPRVQYNRGMSPLRVAETGEDTV